MKHEHGSSFNGDHLHYAAQCWDDSQYPVAIDYCQCGWSDHPDAGLTGAPERTQPGTPTHRHPFEIIHPQCQHNPDGPIVHVDPPDPVDSTRSCEAVYSLTGTETVLASLGGGNLRAWDGTHVPDNVGLRLTMTAGDWDICIDDHRTTRDCYGRSAICQSVNGSSSDEYIKFDGSASGVYVNIVPYSDSGTWTLYAIQD